MIGYSQLKKYLYPVFQGNKSVRAGGGSNLIYTIELENDEATPGENKVYGTDTNGVKGWQTSVQKIPLNRQITSYTLIIDDEEKLIIMDSSSANTVTVPPNSSVPFDLGTQILITQVGLGETSIVAGSGVTINSYGGGLNIADRYAAASLIKIGLNEWLFIGSIST